MDISSIHKAALQKYTNFGLNISLMSKPELMVARKNSLRRRVETLRGTELKGEPILIWVTLNCAIKAFFYILQLYF